jgi:hypothetical protein
MPDLMTGSLQALKGLWGRLPGRSLVLIATGIFDLGAIGGLFYVRSQVGDAPTTVLTLPLSTTVDAALIVLVGLLVVIAISAVIYAVIYRERQ